MNELLKTILSLSLSGALLILVLFLCRPLVKDRSSKRWQYYIWLVVVARLLLPFAPETNLVGAIFQYLNNAVIQADANLQPKPEAPAVPSADQVRVNVTAGRSNNDQSTMETCNIGGRIYYQVVNEIQLRSIGQGEYGLNQNYIQMDDIAMSTDEWVPIGTEDQPFTGSYCGNGFEITGLTMTDPDAKIIGLFGVADGAHIYNITMRDYDIQTAGRNVTGKSIAPILATGLGDTRSQDNHVYPKDR